MSHGVRHLISNHCDTRDRYSVTLLSIRQLNKKRKHYKNMANEIEKRNEAFLIYQDENGIARVNVRFEGEDVWLTVEQIMELFDASQQDVSYHIKQIYADGEQDAERTHKKFLLVRQEGNRSVRRNMSHYNLDMIIAVGYRVKSQVATRFRQWATQHLREFIQKGFTLDDDRLKGKGNRYFRELLQRIRDIRSSERNLYQQVTDIFITSIDYDPNANLTRKFFATVQNKLHYAAHQHTAAEVIYERVDAEKPMVGMTNFKGDYITKEDVQIAKNYLTAEELTYLNLLVSQYLDFAEIQALQQIPMRMAEWIEKLDSLMTLSGRQLLVGKGSISHEEAKKKAIAEFEKYRKLEMLQYESDYDRAIRELIQKENSLPKNEG